MSDMDIDWNEPAVYEHDIPPERVHRNRQNRPQQQTRRSNQQEEYRAHHHHGHYHHGHHRQHPPAPPQQHQYEFQQQEYFAAEEDVENQNNNEESSYDSYDSSDSDDSENENAAVNPFVSPFGSGRSRRSNRTPTSARNRPPPPSSLEEPTVFSCIWACFHNLLHLALGVFVCIVIVVGIILIVTLPPLKCDAGCQDGGCTMTSAGVLKTSSASYVCFCPATGNDDTLRDKCEYKHWSPAALQQFYAALVLLVPTVIICCCGCCIHFATIEKARRARRRLVRPAAPPPPPTTTAEEEVPPELPEDDVESHMEVDTHQTPAEAVSISYRSQHSISSSIPPLATVSLDPVHEDELIKTTAVEVAAQQLEDENMLSEGSNPAYLEAVVLGTFGADEEIDEMAEYREQNELAEMHRQLNVQ